MSGSGVFLATLSAVVVASVTWASEVDQETYSHLPLKDASTEISQQVQNKIQIVIDEINKELNLTTSAATVSDGELEYRFAEKWKEGLSSPWSSEFEECIPKNNCPGWNPIERINLLPGESIFDEVNFNPVTTRYIAPVIQLCGVRMGVDKLTHMFQDGFRFYDLWMNQQRHLTDEQIFQMSVIEERHIMGKTLTAVMSYADVEANLAGVEFFRNLFINRRHLRRTSEGFLSLKEPVDICAYVKPSFDERRAHVEYFGSRAIALKKLIAKRRQYQPPLSDEQINSILARAETHSVSALEIFIGVWQVTRHPLLTANLWDHFPNWLTSIENRRPVQLKD